jgi:hypothetical protein
MILRPVQALRRRDGNKNVLENSPLDPSEKFVTSARDLIRVCFQATDRHGNILRSSSPGENDLQLRFADTNSDNYRRENLKSYYAREMSSDTIVT